MRAADIAWLASVAEICPLVYDRKAQVVHELQNAYKAARTTKTKSIFINVITVHEQEQISAREKEKNKGIDG